MNVIIGSENIAAPMAYPVVTIGNFDGVHLGHQTIFREAARMARENRGTSVVLTFEPHPVKILAPEKTPRLLTPFKKKMERILKCGIDRVVCETFDRQLAGLSAQDFVKTLLVDRLQAREIIVGAEFSFGRDRLGTVSVLKQMGQSLGFGVHIIDPIKIKGEVVSSSRIRALLQAGKVEDAADLLGRPYSLAGLVVQGQQTGNQIGYPTANIQMDVHLIPAQGVYAAWVLVDGVPRQGVVNIGFNPTFQRNRLSVEVHILDFNRQIYGEEIEAEFVRRLRDEIAFSNADALVCQIQKDIQTARKTLFAETS